MVKVRSEGIVQNAGILCIICDLARVGCQGYGNRGLLLSKYEQFPEGFGAGGIGGSEIPCLSFLISLDTQLLAFLYRENLRGLPVLLKALSSEFLCLTVWEVLPTG